MSIYYRWSANVEAAELDGDWTILHAERFTMTTLKDVGAFIWSKLQHPIALNQLVHDVSQAYEVSEIQASQDVSNFLQELSQVGLIEQMPYPSMVSATDSSGR